MFELFKNKGEKKFEKFPSTGEKVSEEKLHRIQKEFEDEIIESAELITLLVCVDGKKGGDINVHFDTEESFDKFIDLLNSMGVNCFVDFDPELTTMENLSQFFTEEEVSSELDEQIEEADMRVRVFMTKKDSYKTDFFEKLEKFKSSDRSRYHRLYGEFLGMPEENIRSFIYDRRSDLSKKILEFFGDRPEQTISDWDMAEKYSEEISEREKENLRTFIYSMYPDKKSSLDKAVEIGKERREKLEEHGVDTEKFIESFQEENWSSRE